jgi:protocatechuate 3,4-dioxygenase beta subunit
MVGRMKRVVPFLLLFIASPVWASITGTVWSLSGDPISDARVVVRRPQTSAERRADLLSPRPQAPLASATTDAHGGFRIEQSIDGVVVIAVEHDGYAPTQILATGGDDGVMFELDRAAPRKGRVTASGKGVAGAHVIAVIGEAPLWVTRSGDDGAFTIPDPSSWVSQIAIVHPDYAPQEVKPHALDVALSKGAVVTGKVVDAGGRPQPNARVSAGPWTTATSADDGTFTLNNVPTDTKKLEAFHGTSWGSAARGPQGTTISIAEAPSISGTVRDAKKRPLAYAAVTAWNKPSFGAMKAAVADDRGRYSIDFCAAGSYMVTTSDTGTLSFMPVTASAGATSVDFTAREIDHLTGIVVDEQKRPVAGATVLYSLPQVPLLYGHQSHDEIPSARSGRDGRFRLRAGEELRKYAANIPLHLRALRRGYALAVSKELDFSSSVTLVLPAGVELQGVVVDANGNAVAGAGVIAVQDPYGAVPLPFEIAMKARTIAPFVESDAEGRFTLRLNPAQHDFAVWKEGQGKGRVGSFDVAPGAGPLKVVLERGVAIRGRVIAPGSKTIAGTIIATDGQMAIGYAHVADDGAFVVDEIQPGTYTLQYSNDDGRTAQVSAKAPANDVAIELQANGTIRGRVVDRATQQVLRSYTVTASPQWNAKLVEDDESFTLDLQPGEIMLKIEASGYQEATQQVMVTAGKTEEVTIFTDRGRVVSGRISDEEGAPVADAMVTANEIDGFTSSDNEGAYTITLPNTPVTFGVQIEGYIEKELELPAGSDDQRLDIVLSRGKRARGRVVTHDGVPVAGAQVMATGDGSPQTARTGEDGAFLVQGLGDGLYVFRAERDDLASEPLTNVDPAAGEIVLRMKPSAGAGAVHGRVKGFSEGGWMFGVVRAANQHAMVGRDGRYRFDRLPAGEVELRAIASGMNGTTSSSRPANVTVVANGEVEVDLQFNNDTVIRGTVYEEGKPAPSRTVHFHSNDALWSAQTDQSGQYTLTGPEPGTNCSVMVTGSQRSFHTQHQVTGSGTFDIHISWSRIEGRVSDETGTPLAGARVEIRRDGFPNGTEDTKSDAAGTFAVTIPKSDGTYSVTVEMEGFATVTQRAIAYSAPLHITMARSEGLRVRLIDSRTGNTLDGYAIAVDEAGRLLARAHDRKPDGTLPLPVGPGTYRIAVSASGYASQLTRSAVPRKDELRVALTPGGSLIVNTDRESNDAIKLVLPTGEEYVQCQCNGIAEIRLTGTRTVVEHVAPGAYSMQVLDARSLIKASYPVTISEGQTTTIEIHVPE